MNALVILDEPFAASQRAAHGIELALDLARAEDLTVRVFLLGDSVDLARSGRADSAEPTGDSAVSRLVSGGVEVAVSERDLAVRGLGQEDLVIGAYPATSARLLAWTLEADRVLVF